MIFNKKDFYKVKNRFKYSEIYYLLYLLIAGLIVISINPNLNSIGMGFIITGLGLIIFYTWEVKEGF